VLGKKRARGCPGAFKWGWGRGPFVGLRAHSVLIAEIPPK